MADSTEAIIVEAQRAAKCIHIAADSAVADDIQRIIDGLIAELRSTQAALTRAREALEQWQECALYDATMEGPKFKGWNRSALDRCLKASRTPGAHE